MSNLFFDTETRCSVRIYDGTDKYTRAAEPIIASWALDDGPAHVWDILAEPLSMPDELWDALDDNDVTIIAHGAQFDRNVLKYGLSWPTPVERWRCTRAQAYAHGLPGSLEMLGAVLGLPHDQQKLVDDGKLIHTFCIPQFRGAFIQPSDRPADWQRFLGYAKHDAIALREIYKRLPRHNFEGTDLEVWWVDQLANNRGFATDVPLTLACIAVLGRAKYQSDASMVAATKGAVRAATERQRLINYLQRTCGLDIPNLKAATVREYLDADNTRPEIRYLLQMRLDGSKSAGSKFKRALSMLGPEDRIRHALQFGGAGRTGRWSGKGFQPHNMLRPSVAVVKDGRHELSPVKASYIDEVVIPGIYSGDVLSSPETFGTANEACGLALRHAIVAASGCELVVADYSNIESVKLAWLADETWKLDLFRAKQRDPHNKALDAYRLLYSKFFGTPLEKIDDNQRNAGKVVELACGFGGGVGAVVTMAASYNIDLDTLPALILPDADEDSRKKAFKAWRRAFLRAEDFDLEPEVYQACDVLKQKYREANDAINQMRHALGASVRSVILDHDKNFFVAKCQIWCSCDWLIIQLPSGRRLLYANPKIETEVDTDVETGKTQIREYVTYLTARGKSWHRERAWSGLFLENIVQASANDILRNGLRAVHEDALKTPAIAAYLNGRDADERTAIVLHVHDEIVVEVPVGSYPVARLVEMMCNSSPWAAGMPIMAEGWHGPRYGKR